ncbi:MAG TPA: LacI family DNA-binding transcriptional regulator [Opitutus sp.]|nr:LacI family DNA-binding transcriptional regulator [Opitutus sp.]
MPRPTLKAVAAIAGVTPATVSMALRGSGKISAETIRRVEKAAHSLGYRPDPTLTRLMSYLRQGEARPVATLGMITVREKPAAWRESSHLRRYYDAALKRGAELGFRIEELWLGAPNLTPKRMKEILLARGIEGLFVFSGYRWKYFQDFDFSPFACATYGRWNGSQRLMDRAGENYYLDVLRVIAELRQLGYTRPGLVLQTELDERTGHLYSAGYLWCEQQRRTPTKIPVLMEDEMNEKAFARWFRKHRPDAIIAHTPTAAEYARWLGRLGARVPDDVGLVALDLDPNDPLQPSGIRQDSERVGAAVVDMIATKLQRGERGLSPSPRVLLFEGEWIAGTTTRRK